jgi:hypothetical protein
MQPQPQHRLSVVSSGLIDLFVLSVEPVNDSPSSFLDPAGQNPT